MIVPSPPPNRSRPSQVAYMLTSVGIPLLLLGLATAYVLPYVSNVGASYLIYNCYDYADDTKACISHVWYASIIGVAPFALTAISGAVLLGLLLSLLFNRGFSYMIERQAIIRRIWIAFPVFCICFTLMAVVAFAVVDNHFVV